LVNPILDKAGQKGTGKWTSAIALDLSVVIPNDFDIYRIANLPLNLTQSYRDFFGSHAYEHVDKTELGAIHTEWEGLLEKRAHDFPFRHALSLLVIKARFIKKA
jgi:6-phosphogluconate dehydrogenase